MTLISPNGGGGSLGSILPGVPDSVVTGAGGTGDTSVDDTSPVSPDQAADAFALPGVTTSALIPGGGDRQTDPILVERDQAPAEEPTADGAQPDRTKLERFGDALTDQRWDDAWAALTAGSFTTDPRAWPLWTWAALLALWAVIAFGASRRL